VRLKSEQRESPPGGGEQRWGVTWPKDEAQNGGGTIGYHHSCSIIGVGGVGQICRRRRIVGYKPSKPVGGRGAAVSGLALMPSNTVVVNLPLN